MHQRLDVKLLQKVLIALLGMITAKPCTATGCWFRILKPMNFGNYNPFKLKPDRAYGQVQVKCYEKQFYRLKVSLSAGYSNSFQERTMRLGGNGKRRLIYNIYTNAARTIIWGDGSGGTEARYTNRKGPFTKVYGVYGKIPPLQTQVESGRYNDYLYINLDF